MDAHPCRRELLRRLAVSKVEIALSKHDGEKKKKAGTHLNSLRRALAASLAFPSVADARSQTSRTTAQSSDEVAVKYPRATKLETKGRSELGQGKNYRSSS